MKWRRVTRGLDVDLGGGLEVYVEYELPWRGDDDGIETDTAQPTKFERYPNEDEGADMLPWPREEQLKHWDAIMREVDAHAMQFEGEEE